ncbi:ribosomal RNA processing protein 36 homolog [Rhinatrema bivittatum]|uniref:ribosomal RNA processing protein 36 homolog n=1 Tax=Rhinatrema bivittatum TaxID=194408 RepID=UPI00112E0DAE|nr:ribosomal RNA processing protein 36 homolog [Rhinatrema bivittatum]XP_029448648.1 ribosomal RNA processing protein 36 homolog [Rhinatrema bivittatum]XP_029448649.1 ribosomal RNA processing protein 36 homolog [Rhinatrema bivittatum]XP_029448651.1 ribosomal RNA processing protein 36 homolog [Rhinatrema bivittatum]
MHRSSAQMQWDQVPGRAGVRRARTGKKRPRVPGGIQERMEEEEEREPAWAGSSSEDEQGQSQACRPPTAREPEELRKELSGMSFEELLQLQNKVGTKLYNQVAYGAELGARDGPKKKARLNKNRPIEVSSKKPVPFLRQIVPVKKKVHRDPRFDDLSGEYNPEVFEKTYSFLRDIKEEEEEVVQKKLKKTRDPVEKEKLQQLLKRMVQQEASGRSQQKWRAQQLVLKRQQRDLAKAGRKPFYLKKSEKRKLELAEKYELLKKSGKLQSFLSKKRKRNASKDQRKMPFSKNC